MVTGIHIRALVNGRWQAMDLADKAMPMDTVITWLQGQEGERAWRLVELLIGAIQDREHDATVPKALAAMLIGYARGDV